MEAADTPPLCHRLPGFRYIVCGRVSDHPGVALLEIARPERHNSFHEELWEEFPRVGFAMQGLRGSATLNRTSCP